MAARGRPKGANGTPADTVSAIGALAAVGFNAADIVRVLGEKSPPPRTVRSIVQREQLDDASGAWSPMSGTEPGASLEHVLDVLRVVVLVSEGRRTYLTKHEVGRIAQIAAAAPDMGSLAMFRLARLYLARSRDAQSTEDLDLYLAFAPWRNDELAEAYAEFVSAGRIGSAAEFLPGTPKGDRNYDDPEVRRRRLREIRERLEIDSVLYEGETSG